MTRRTRNWLLLAPAGAWFLVMQYWLGGSDDNVEGMIRFLIGRYARRPNWSGGREVLPVEYPEVGLYHPDLPDHHIVTELLCLTAGSRHDLRVQLKPVRPRYGHFHTHSGRHEQC